MKQYSRCSRCALILAVSLLPAILGGTAQAAITYVDVTDGVSGNTMQYASGTWQAWTAYNGQTGVANDGIWDKTPPFGNSATSYQNAATGLIDTNATRLRTTVTVPAPGPGQYYNVYAIFWTDPSTTWELAASVTNTPGQLPIYQQSAPGVTRFWASTSDTVTRYSTNLTPNPFTTQVIISQLTRRLLMTPVLGEVTGSNITVYMEPDRNQPDSNHRTVIDGIGYELIGNSIFATNIQNTGSVGMSYHGTAGRSYMWEWTGSLNPPVAWTTIQQATADSSGMLSLTDTPSGSPTFYRVRDVTPPPAPVSGLTATAGNAQVSLSWAASTGATSYNVKNATNSGGPYTTIANLYPTNFVNAGLVNGTTYYYVVSALNFNGESANSSEVSAAPIPPIPAIPTGLTATAGNNLVLLSWTASSNATSYNVKSATTSGGPYTTITNVTATSFANTGLANGTTYYYVVSAQNAYNESANSSETNATPAPVPPAAPTGLTAAAGNTQVLLNWTASLGATSYNAKSATASGGPYTTFTNVTGTSVIATGLVNNTPYFFVVSALNAYGEGANSSETNATPGGPPPYYIGTWEGFRPAAISYTFDDDLPNQYALAVPMFHAAGFRLTLFTVTTWVPGGNWSPLTTAAFYGDEIASHTVTHVDLTTVSSSQLAAELTNSQTTINQNITNQQCLTIAYPNCSVPDESVVAQYYIAGRGCSGQIMPSTPLDFMNISSFVLGEQGLLNISDINSEATNALASGGWCVYLIHSLDDDGGYSPLPSSTLQQNVDYISANQSQFWVDTFGNVVRYIKERNAASVTELFNTGTSITVQVTDNLDNSIYNFPITIRRPLSSGWSSASASQGGNDLGAQIVTVSGTNYVMFDAVPNAGNVTILKQ